MRVPFIVLAFSFVFAPLLLAQESSKQANPANKLSVALQHDYAPDPKSKRPDSKQFFTFPFDLARQDAPAADVDYSPDGKFLAFGMGWYHMGGWFAVWDLENDKEKFAFWLGLGIRSVQYSPDGKTIAVSCFDQSAKIFDAENGKQVAVLPVTGTNGTNSVSFSPDGSTIATGGLHSLVILWDTKTYQERMRLVGHEARIYCATYSPNGEMIGSVDHNGIGIVWNATTGEQVSELEGHPDGIEAVDFTRDSSYVLTTGWDGTVRFWDPQTGVEDEDLRSSQQLAMCVATSPDGKYVASGGRGNEIELFDYQNNETIRFPHECSQQLYGLCYSPDGKEFASASFDGTIKRWDAEDQELIATIDMAHHDSEDPMNPVLATAWSDDGNTIVSGHEDGSVRIRDAMTGRVQKLLDAHSAEVAAVSISPDSRLLATCGCDNAIRLWNLNQPAAQQELEKTELEGHTDWVISCSFSRDGQWLATGSADHTIRVWDVQQRKQVRLLEDHQSLVRSVAFSPDGKWLISGEDSGQVLKWDTSTWQGSKLIKRNKFRRVCFSPSGDRLAVGFEVGGVFLFDPATWEQTLKLEKTFGLTSMAWSPQGRFMIIGNLKGKIMLRDPDSGELIKTFGQHRMSITGLDYAPSGNAFVSSSLDFRLLRWKAIPMGTRSNDLD